MFSAMKQVKQLNISGFRVFAQDGSFEKNIHLKKRPHQPVLLCRVRGENLIVRAATEK